MLYTEESVRANIRSREGKRVFFLGKGDTLTPGAKDFLHRERIEVRPAEEAPMREYRLLSGGILQEKPEHLTHLQGNILVAKNHPRIVFRGMLDSLQAEILLCMTVVQEKTRELGELLALARKIMRCDVLSEALPEDTLCGLTQQELRERSHRPQAFYGQPHFMPEWEDGVKILTLNRLRCQIRGVERAAVEAYRDENGNPTRVDLLRALNRMSSMVYILMIQCKLEG